MADQNIDIEIRARAILDEAGKQISGLMKNIEQQSESASKKSGMSFGEMAKVTTVVAGAVTGLAAGIGTLGARGADVADVRDAFDQLNATIGNDSKKVLDTLRTQFAGTVSDFELMKMANTGLQSGLKASDADFQLLANGARVLADRTGQDATTAFNTLVQAMATGKTKGAELLVGVIDNDRAIEAYANKVRKAKEDLTEQEKIEALSIATKMRLKATVGEASGATADFGDKIAQSKVKITNMVDGIGTWVATTPAVGGWASAITGVSGAVTVTSAAIGPLKGLVGTLTPMMGTAGMAGAATSAAGALGTTTVALRGMLMTLGPVALAIGAVMAAWQIGQMESVKNKIAEWTLRLGGMDAAQAKAAVSATAAAESARKQAEAAKQSDEAMKGAAAAANTETAALDLNSVATKSAKDAAKELAEWKGKQAAAYRALNNEMAALEIEQIAKAQEKAKALADADRQALDQMREHGREMAAQELADRDAAALLYLQREKEKHEAEVALDAAAWKVMSDARNAAGLAMMEADAKRMKSGLANLFTDLPNVILATFQGGGDVGKAVGGSIFNKLFDDEGPLGKLFGKGGDALGKLIGGNMGKKLGETFGSLAGPLGTLLGGMAGDLIGPLIGKVGGFFKSLFGGPDGIEVEGRKVAATFRNEIASLLTPLQRAEAGTDEWKKSVIGVRDAFIAAGRTEQEALAIMDRLWKAEKQGGDAVRQVIAEINSVMGQTAQTTAATATIAITGFERMQSEILDVGSAFAVVRNEMERPIVTQRITEEFTVHGQGSARGHVEAWSGYGMSGNGETFEVWKRRHMDENPTTTTQQLQEAWSQNLPGGWSDLGIGDFPGTPDHETRGSAGGGIYSRPTMRVLAETRPEMVGEPDMIASAFMKALRAMPDEGRSGGPTQIVVPIYLAGSKIDEHIIDLTNRGIATGKIRVGRSNIVDRIGRT